MPDYDHECQNKECAHEWEASYSIKADPPKLCPKCGQETAKRVISAGPRGVVELAGQELVDKIKADAQQIKREASRDANKYANLIGEERYHQIQTQMDRRGR